MKPFMPTQFEHLYPHTPPSVKPYAEQVFALIKGLEKQVIDSGIENPQIVLEALFALYTHLALAAGLQIHCARIMALAGQSILAMHGLQITPAGDISTHVHPESPPLNTTTH